MSQQVITKEAELNNVDFSKTHLCLGIDNGPTAEDPWLALDEEDLGLLRHLLTKVSITGSGSSGSDPATFATAFDVSKGLRQLALWAAAAERFMKSQAK